jgi:alginate O-acetyltransferase complex protein AlgI
VIVLIVAGVLGLYFVALSSEAVRARASARGLDLPLWLLLAASLVADAALVLLFPLPVVGRTMVPLGAAVLAAHIVAYSLDIRRGQASAPRPLVLALYLLQFPLLVAGPLVRFRDFALQQARLSTSLGAFTYGTRRITIGLIKVWAIAGILSGPVDEIFLLPPAKVGAAAAWLAAVCVSLEIYFEFSGYADIAIGLGRMLGFRYPENFRRPYTADSVREFWRRWNVTLMTWLRDYLRLPIAGRDNPSPRLYLNIVAGFCIVGLWHGGGQSVLVWAVYSSLWLAFEAIGLGSAMARLPAVVRHTYLLLVVVIGWAMFRAGTIEGAWGFLKAMAGMNGAVTATALSYFTASFSTTLGLALFFAGPMVPAISRWRVSLDAATASLLMMLAATGLFVWRPVATALDFVLPARRVR